METTSRRTLLTTGATLALLGGLTSLLVRPLAAQASNDSSDDRGDKEHGRRHEHRHHHKHGRRHS